MKARQNLGPFTNQKKARWEKAQETAGKIKGKKSKEERKCAGGSTQGNGRSRCNMGKSKITSG